MFSDFSVDDYFVHMGEERISPRTITAEMDEAWDQFQSIWNVAAQRCASCSMDYRSKPSGLDSGLDMVHSVRNAIDGWFKTNMASEAPKHESAEVGYVKIAGGSESSSRALCIKHAELS
mmetsp:Transcript_25269/g.71262  ORF Transcript_25269/g.71262 Transcript_25269/m.71262 type:complete len:119 (+) Transcript_25269:71-427(+)